MARLTPMQRHQLRTQAAQASTTQAATGQQRALQWLHTQRALLSALQSRQAREAHKAQVLPEIEPYLHGVLEADTGAVDPVVQYAAVWSLDAGEWQLAIDLGQYAIRHGIPMPDEFQRNAPTLLLDLLADAALTGAMARDEINLHLPVAIAITEGQNMPDQTRAKAHKAIAYGLAGKTTLAGQAGSWKGLAANTLRLALKHLTTAEQLDTNSGVKKDIAAVQRLIAAAEKPAAPAPAPAPTPARKTTARKKPAAKKTTT